MAQAKTREITKPNQHKLIFKLIRKEEVWIKATVTHYSTDVGLARFQKSDNTSSCRQCGPREAPKDSSWDCKFEQLLSKNKLSTSTFHTPRSTNSTDRYSWRECPYDESPLSKHSEILCTDTIQKQEFPIFHEKKEDGKQ